MMPTPINVRNYIISIVLTVLLAACTESNTPKREPQPTDALYTEDAAMSIYDHDPERALLILDSAEMGVILSHLGRTEEGLAKLDEVIRHLDGSGSINRLDASIVAMRRKINVLNANGRSEEIIPIANRIVEKLNHCEQYPNQYANDSYRLLPDSADRADYIDFCRAQAYGYLADAYSNDTALARHPSPSSATVTSSSMAKGCCR